VDAGPGWGLDWRRRGISGFQWLHGINHQRSQLQSGGVRLRGYRRSAVPGHYRRRDYRPDRRFLPRPARRTLVRGNGIAGNLIVLHWIVVNSPITSTTSNRFCRIKLFQLYPAVLCCHLLPVIHATKNSEFVSALLIAVSSKRGVTGSGGHDIKDDSCEGGIFPDLNIGFFRLIILLCFKGDPVKSYGYDLYNERSGKCFSRSDPGPL